MKYDYLVVGAGLYGAVFAHEAKAKGKNVLVIDKRDHIAGNVYTEEIEGIHIKWQTIKFSLIICYRRVCKTVKFCKLGNIFPHLLIVCVENMRTIFMHVDTFYFLRIDIPRDMISFVND